MCYVFPTMAAVVTSVAWKRTRSEKIWWLNLLFWGGAIFGLVDHLWNGELFLISKDWLKDVSLGIVITVVIVSAWAAALFLAQRRIICLQKNLP